MVAVSKLSIYEAKFDNNILARVACVRGHGTKCPLLIAFFLSLLSLSEVVTFLPEGVIVGFPNFACGFKSQEILDLG